MYFFQPKLTLTLCLAGVGDFPEIHPYTLHSISWRSHTDPGLGRGVGSLRENNHTADDCIQHALRFR